MYYAQHILVNKQKAVLDIHLRTQNDMTVDMILRFLVRPILLFNWKNCGIKITNELELFH